MKHMFMMAILMSGFLFSNVQAQSCTPCPPGCCVANCCKSATGAAVSTGLLLEGIIPAAICTPEEIAACQSGKKVSNKDMKECQKACTPATKSACASGTKSTCGTPAAANHASEASIDKTYHQVSKPSKS